MAVTSAWWEAGPIGSWSAFTVKVANGASTPFTGEVVLVPRPLVQRVNGGDGASPAGAPPLTAQYRAAVTLEPASELDVAIPLVVSGIAFQVEIRDGVGQVVARAPGPVGVQVAGGDRVGVLTDTAIGRATALGSAGVAPSARFSSARDFPTDASALAGLRAILLADFDSAALSRLQLQALSDFVGLGGSLLLGGGAGAARTVGPLPDELTPLLPAGLALASLAPVADLTGLEGDEAVTVATGELRVGRSVLQGADGVPLLVEASYGAGSIVQMAFDPVAESAKPGARLVRPAVQVALALAGVGGSGLGEDSTQPPGPPGAAAAGVLDVTTDPADRPLLWLAAVGLVAYALAIPVGFAVLRSRGSLARTWALAPAVAVGLVVVVWALAVGPSRRQVVDAHLQVQRVGTGGVVRVDSWHRLAATGGGPELRLRPGSLVWVGSPAERASHLSDPMVSIVGDDPPRQTRPGQETVDVGVATRVSVDGWPVGSTRLVEASSVARPGGLEADLRLVGRRVTGRVTNKGEATLRHLIARAPDGSRAQLAGVVAGGASVRVDAPLVALDAAPGEQLGGGGAGEPGGDDAQDRVDLYAFALRGPVAGPGRLDLVAQVAARPDLRVDGRRPRGTALAAMVATVRVAGADSLVGGLAVPRRIYAGPSGRPSVYDIELPAGVAGSRPVALVATGMDGAAAPGAVEVFNWASRTWRARPEVAGGPAVLGADEVVGGVVRVRTGGPALVSDLKVVSP